MERNHRFDLFRLSLRKRQQADISDYLEDTKTRYEWIRHIFSQQVEFRHRGSDYVYIPLQDSGGGEVVVGRLGRKVYQLENRSPEEGYEEYIHDAWKASVIVVDPTEHKDGQKLAFQHNSDVGKPQALAPLLIRAMERKQDWLQFLTSVHPITNKEAFKDYVRRNEGKITRIRFELEVPNMFGAEDEFDKEMKAFRDKEKAQKVIVEIKNPDGVNAESDRVKFTAEKAMSQGTGTVTASAVGRGNKFSSKEQQESTTIPVEGDGDTEPLVKKASSLASWILGRE